MGKWKSITENYHFRRAYKRGNAIVNSILITYIVKTKEGKNESRVGITTSAKIGNAVNRNRARRVIRAAYQQLVPQVKPGYDIVFVARARTCKVKSSQVLNIMRKQLSQAGVLREEGCNLVY